MSNELMGNDDGTGFAVSSSNAANKAENDKYKIFNPELQKIFSDFMSTMEHNEANKQKCLREAYQAETSAIVAKRRFTRLNKMMNALSTRSYDSIDFERVLNRRDEPPIKPAERIASRANVDSDLYQPGGPYHAKWQAKKDRLLSHDQSRSDFDMGMLDDGEVEMTNDATSDEDYEEGDGVESVIGDNMSEGTAADDDDATYDVDSQIDDEDSNVSMYSSSRRLSRPRLTSGSLSPAFIGRRRTGTIDADFSPHAGGMRKRTVKTKRFGKKFRQQHL